MSRGQAETDLLDRGMVDGRFLVRLKKEKDDIITYAVSYTFDQAYKHHLLSKRHSDHCWLVNKQGLLACLLCPCPCPANTHPRLVQWKCALSTSRTASRNSRSATFLASPAAW